MTNTMTSGPAAPALCVRCAPLPPTHGPHGARCSAVYHARIIQCRRVPWCGRSRPCSAIGLAARVCAIAAAGALPAALFCACSAKILQYPWPHAAGGGPMPQPFQWHLGHLHAHNAMAGAYATSECPMSDMTARMIEHAQTHEYSTTCPQLQAAMAARGLPGQLCRLATGCSKCGQLP